MKLWHSFMKELQLASKSFYFYIEVGMALILLFVIMFVIPETFSSKADEYLYLDMPTAQAEGYTKLLEGAALAPSEEVEIKIDGRIILSTHFETEENDVYLLRSREDILTLTEKKRQIGASIIADETGAFRYEYYLQGYETQKLKNLLLILNPENMDVLSSAIEDQEVRPLSENITILTDKQNTMPSLLTFNGSLMGLFIIAAYIFLDKKEGILTAYAVTASSIWQYLMSKTLVIIATSIVSSFILVLPIMGLRVNYLLLLVFLITTGFFASSLGLLIASFYNNITQAFGAIYIVMMAMIVPAIAFFIPGWSPAIIKFIPSYYIIEGFHDIVAGTGDSSFILLSSLGFLIAGAGLFLWSNQRYKKTLSV